MKLKFQEIQDFGGLYPKNSGQYSRFSRGLLFTDGSVQKALVRAVTSIGIYPV